MHAAKATLQIESHELERLESRFYIRSKAVSYVRTAFLVLVLALSLLPNWYDDDFPLVKIACFCFFYHVLYCGLRKASKFSRWSVFIALCCDLVVIFFCIKHSGNLTSPLMALVPCWTMLFIILFHSVVVVIPPLLILPAITYSLPANSMHFLHTIGVLFIYSSLHAGIIYLVVYCLSREEEQTRQIMTLEKKLKRLAVLEERTRLSRDIHDGLGGTLSGLVIQAEYLQQIAKQSPSLMQEIQELKVTAEDAVEEARRAISMMRDDFELVAQLRNMCHRFSLRHKIITDIDIKGDIHLLTQQQQLALCRIVQECFNNIIKHAHAKRVEVHARQDSLRSLFAVDIKDDGLGFDPSNTPKNHYGLLTMKERAKKVGGSLEISSKMGYGTKVSLTLPYTL